MGLSKEEHFEWARSRALLYCLDGNPYYGILSFMSDLGKHEELKRHPALQGCYIILETPAISKNVKFVYKYINDLRL